MAVPHSYCLLTSAEVRRNEDAGAHAAGGRRAPPAAGRGARAAGVSPQHVSDVLLGRRDVGPAMLALLGVQRVIRYVATGVRS